MYSIIKKHIKPNGTYLYKKSVQNNVTRIKIFIFMYICARKFYTVVRLELNCILYGCALRIKLYFIRLCG